MLIGASWSVLAASFGADGIVFNNSFDDRERGFVRVEGAGV